MEKRKCLPLHRFELRPLGRPARSQSLYRLRYMQSTASNDELQEIWKEAVVALVPPEEDNTPRAPCAAGMCTACSSRSNPRLLCTVEATSAGKSGIAPTCPCSRRVTAGGTFN
jgi:hypothetical protein